MRAQLARAAGACAACSGASKSELRALDALAVVAVAAWKLLARGLTARNDARPGCELYGRVFRMTVQHHCMGARQAAEQRRIVPQLPPNGRMCVWEGKAVAYARNSTIRASLWPGSGPPNRADRPDAELALYSAQRARCARHPEWAFPRVGPTGSLARLRGARAPYGRVLGTHGRPAMGTC